MNLSLHACLSSEEIQKFLMFRRRELLTRRIFQLARGKIIDTDKCCHFACDTVSFLLAILFSSFL